MYVVRKPIDTRNVTNVDEINVLVGQFVAIYHEKVYNLLKRLPMIGRVIGTEDQDELAWVHIELWKGSYTGKWTCPKKPILEWLTKESVILYDFALTDKNKLRTATKLKLKELYAEYVNDCDCDIEDEENME